MMTATALLLIVVILTGCTGTNTASSDSLTAAEENAPHADNDIAMTIRSIMDAMNVEQPLDSAEYNYQGILTDGSGRPLYTDIQGAPGQWSVEVISPGKARLKNVYLGDLVPEELTQYLLTSLDIPDSLLMREEAPIPHPDTDVAVYDFGSGHMIFEVLEGKTESGHRGPLVNIILMKKTDR